MLLALRHHLYSDAGESGLTDALGRAQAWIGPLTAAWRSRNDGEKGISQLFHVLVDAIAALDSFDLRPRGIRLRPITDGEIPVGVICKLVRALVEYFAAGDELAERDALESLAAAGRSCIRAEFELGLRAALAEFLIEKGAYDLATATIGENLLVRSLCPYSQHLLYRALLKQKEAGVITAAPGIGLDDVSDRFCERPFNSIATSPPSTSPPIGNGGSKPVVYACRCPSMLPYPIAGFPSRQDEHENIENVWNGREIQEIRRSIIEGDFTYCSRTTCHYLTNGSLPKKDDITDPVLRDIIDNKRTYISSPPRVIVLSHDAACNLACPSCRNEIITTRNDAREEMESFVDRLILPLMQDADVDLCVAGNGDPIGSKHYRKLLHNLDPVRHRGVRLLLQSNGLLLTPKEWESLWHIHHLVSAIGISIDAAEPATYEDLRRPGKWTTLTENMDFLGSLRRTGKIPYLYICFVVQKKNFEQMPAFVELGQAWAVDKVMFTKLTNFESFHANEFQRNAVVETSHPDHLKFLEVLKHPILRSKVVDLFNIASYQNVLSEPRASPDTARRQSLSPALVEGGTGGPPLLGDPV